MDEIRTTSTNKKTPYSRWNIVRKAATKYDEDPKFRMNGKNVSIKDFTNNNAVDCNIYEVIEKYRGDLKMSQAELNVFHTEMAEELSRIKNLPDALMQIKQAEEAWKNLPLDTRAQFGHSVQRFIKNGGEYLNKKINEYNQMIEKQMQSAIEVPTTKPEQEVK